VPISGQMQMNRLLWSHNTWAPASRPIDLQMQVVARIQKGKFRWPGNLCA